MEKLKLNNTEHLTITLLNDEIEISISDEGTFTLSVVEAKKFVGLMQKEIESDNSCLKIYNNAC